MGYVLDCAHVHTKLLQTIEALNDDSFSDRSGETSTEELYKRVQA